MIEFLLAGGSEVDDVDLRAMQQMRTEGCVDWMGFHEAIARETDALLGRSASVRVLDEGVFAKSVPSEVERARDGLGGRNAG